MTTTEMMAVEVLKGDLVAARALADLLLNELQDGARVIQPVKKLTCDVRDVRVVIYIDLSVPNAQVDYEAVTENVNNWLDGGDPLVVTGVTRVDLYELADS